MPQKSKNQSKVHHIRIAGELILKCIALFSCSPQSAIRDSRRMAPMRLHGISLSSAASRLRLQPSMEDYDNRRIIEHWHLCKEIMSAFAMGTRSACKKNRRGGEGAGRRCCIARLDGDTLALIARLYWYGSSSSSERDGESPKG